MNIDEQVSIAQSRINPWWFYNQVRSGGEWDYKHWYGSEYEDFGNFFYGIVGKAFAGGFGFTDFMLYNEAGIYQYNGPNKGPPEWGIPASRSSYIAGESGTYPYGDDPWDRYMIGRGIQYYQGRYEKK